MHLAALAAGRPADHDVRLARPDVARALERDPPEHQRPLGEVARPAAGAVQGRPDEDGVVAGGCPDGRDATVAERPGVDGQAVGALGAADEAGRVRVPLLPGEHASLPPAPGRRAGRRRASTDDGTASATRTSPSSSRAVPPDASTRRSTSSGGGRRRVTSTAAAPTYAASRPAVTPPLAEPAGPLKRAAILMPPPGCRTRATTSQVADQPGHRGVAVVGTAARPTGAGWRAPGRSRTSRRRPTAARAAAPRGSASPGTTGRRPPCPPSRRAGRRPRA